MLCESVYLLRKLPITLSTCILRCAIARVSSTSLALSWHLLLVKAGILTSAHIIPTLSLISKPRSANNKSPGNSLLRSPQFSVMCLLDARSLRDVCEEYVRVLWRISRPSVSAWLHRTHDSLHSVSRPENNKKKVRCLIFCPVHRVNGHYTQQHNRFFPWLKLPRRVITIGLTKWRFVQSATPALEQWRHSPIPYNIPPTLNPTLILTDSVSRSKHKIKQ